MASRQSVGSILKPPKVRAPLKEIESVDPDSDENTASLAKRKVSFSGMNKIKMYNTGATSLTVNQAPMFDEHLSVLSDSSNAEKTKLSGKFEKSYGQINLESTNCTNVDNNARVIIEYESPNDNMEITEALSGKILSDTIYTIDNNGSEHLDYYSVHSESNMEITEALKVGQILQSEIESDLNSTCMSETFVDEESIEEVMTQSNSLFNKFEKNTPNVSSYSSNMDFTCLNKKTNIMDLSCSNTQLSNMELTCMTSKSQKCFWSNDDSILFNPDSTELSNKQTIEDGCNLELDYEISQNSIFIESEVTHEIIANDNCKSENIQDKLCARNPEINYSNNQTITTSLKNDEDVFEKLSSSVVSMDVDPTLEENDYDIIYLNVDNTRSVMNDQNNSTMPIVEAGTELNNSSNAIDLNYQDNKSKIFTGPTDSSLVQEISPEDNSLELIAGEIHKETFDAYTPVLDQNKYIENNVLMVEEIKAKKYSRKSMKIMPALIQESVLKSYSRKSIAPTSNLNVSLNQTQFCENEDLSLDLSNGSTIIKENKLENSKQLIEPVPDFDLSHTSENEDVASASAVDKNVANKSYSRKSIVPTFNLNQTQFCENEDLSLDLSNASTTVKEDILNNYSIQSIEPISVFIKANFSENENVADASATDKNVEQKSYCEKSTIPTSNLNQTNSCENINLSNKSTTVNDTEQDIYLKKSIEPTSVFDLTHSLENKNVSETSAVVEESKKKSYSRKTFGPSSFLTQHAFSDDSTSDNSLMSEDCNEFNHKKSIASVAPVNTNNISIQFINSNIQPLDESKHYEEILMSKIEQKSVLFNVSEDDFKSPFRKKSKKSIVPIHLTNQSTDQLFVEHANNLLNDNKTESEVDNYLENVDGVNEMDISAKLESENYIKTNMSFGKMENGITLPSSSALNKLSLIEKVPNSSINKNENFSNLLQKNLIEVDPNVNGPHTDTNILNDGLNKEEINDKSIKINDIDKINNIEHSTGIITNNSCIEGLANMSISDEMPHNYEQSFTGNRKRSYSDRDNRDYNIPLSCSTFISKPNVDSSSREDFSKENCIEKTSPIQDSIINEESLLKNYIKADESKEEFVEEILRNEVIEFLTRWNNHFIDNKLTVHKCTNREWIFNVLDGNIVLMITYLPIFNDNSFLKVGDISFTSKTISPNEIFKFGINWILSKYNPKFYKQICFTSRDVELLLKSLLDDIHFICKVMDNMSYVSDIHCVTFKDSKAQFILHNMDCLMMIRFEILLSNIHKLSVKDITVDCLFGVFNTKIVDETMKNIAKDCNILQSLIEKLKKICTDQVTSMR